MSAEVELLPSAALESQCCSKKTISIFVTIPTLGMERLFFRLHNMQLHMCNLRGMMEVTVKFRGITSIVKEQLWGWEWTSPPVLVWRKLEANIDLVIHNPFPCECKREISVEVYSAKGITFRVINTHL